MAEMEELIRKRGRIKAKLTRICSFGEQIATNGATEADIKIRLEMLKEIWTEFDCAQTKIECMSREPELNIQEQEQEEFESKFCAIKAKLMQFQELSVVSQVTSSNSIPTELSSNVKLPAIQLPTFGGDYQQWASFSDLFNSVIHQNGTLSPVQKLHYLKAAMRGDAARLLSTIAITDNNYSEAWKILKDRYSNKRQIVQAHLRSLHAQPKLGSESASDIRKLIDVTVENVRALNAMGMPTDHWDCMLVFMVTERLDSHTHRQWELFISDNDNPSFQELKDFMEKRCRALEATGSEKKKLPGPSRGADGHSGRRTSSVVHHTTTTNCIKCKMQHSLYKCDEFLNLSIEQRIEFVKNSQLCFNCIKSGHVAKDCRYSSCKKCHKPHNTLLHREVNNDTRVNQDNANVTNHYGSKDTLYRPTQILLATAVVNVLDNMGKLHQVRALLDSGSQATLITEACVQQLGLKRIKSNVAIGGLGAVSVGTSRGVVNLKLSSMQSDFSFELQALILSKVTGTLPLHPIDPVQLKTIIHDHDVELADPKYYQPRSIDLLLGADIYYELLLSGKFKDTMKTTVFQNTKLGWIISGPISVKSPLVHIVSHLGMLDLSHQLKEFWELEELAYSKPFTSEEMECEEHFKATHSRNEEGRFIVQLPFHGNKAELGNTYKLAQSRLLQIERRLENNITCKHEYQKFMEDYLNLNHLEIVELDETSEIAYHLPHHYVIKESSSTTKLRVVFDGTARPKTGLSLNESLLVGPTIQEELFSIIMRFRMHNFVFTADITKMYRQILVHPMHQDYQRILWRTSPTQPIREFRLKTLTYGTATAPFLAIRCLIELARSGEKIYPQGSEVIKRDFYVDDLMSGADTIEEALLIQRQLIELLASGGFELRKWNGNDLRLTEELPDHLCNHNSTQDLGLNTVKTLGIDWQPGADQFAFKITPQLTKVNTKRTVLAQISKLFDPMGWLAPVVLQGKIMIQRLWCLGVDWDQDLPNELETFWSQYQAELPLLEKLTIKRQMTKDSSFKECQLHGFCDASESAYGAVVFLRSTSSDGTAMNLVCSKSRVAPLKKVSLPRLELCGAFILARLLKRVSNILSVDVKNIYAWTDSMIVLSWLQKPPHVWKTFVANRTTEIQELIPPERWRHVDTKDNPADCLSRGLFPKQIIDHPLWWCGPAWLKLENDQWPIQPSCAKECAQVHAERRKEKILIHTSSTEPELLSKYSSLNKLVRITAYCRRFATNCRHKKNKKSGWLTTDELVDSLMKWIRLVQNQYFGDEIKRCIENRSLSSTSDLISLYPFVDSRGIMRVGGRLQEADIPYNSKHPIILPHQGTLTTLVVTQAHLENLHAGPNLLLNVLRGRYWILKARQTVRKVIHQCVVCFRHRIKTSQQLMGNLPQGRVEPARAFLRCGVDYAGPFSVRLARGRGNIRTYKAYICVFVCFTTRAIHIELVSDLTTQAFIAALRRFTSRRGKPADIYSDCGTNFVGAERELHRLTSSLQHNQVLSKTMSNDNTNWHFNPPASPHFGGLWEAGVKSIKHHFRCVVGNITLTYEELYTVLTQVEACLNSRPLCPLSDDPTELGVLTPGHFLIGEALTALPDQDVTQLKTTRMARWELTQKLYQHFWKRWSTEYLSYLQQRPKWATLQPNIEVGDLVILKENDRPPLNWPLARVIEVHPSKDNVVNISVQL